MLSIVIPALNEEKYLPNLLNCLINQSFKDFEVIIVDAHSEDKTKEEINKFKKSLNMKFLNSEKRNVSYQRNLGLENSKNEKILFLDADTTFDNKFLESSSGEISKKEIKVCGALLYPDSKNILDNFFFFLFRNYIKLLHKNIGVNGCCIFTLKSLHKKVNGFDESIKVSEDFDYTKRLREFAPISMLKSVKIYTSVRRFEKYGRIKTGLKIFMIGLYTLFIGNVKKDIFKYRFDHLKKK